MTKSDAPADVEFDVALSFAGEDRGAAELLAAELKRRQVRVFYDEYEKADLWGKDLYAHLADVYANRAQYCVMFLSEHYARKAWTNFERRSAQERAFRENRDYILPVRIDGSSIPGISAGIGYLDWIDETPGSIADLVLEKLKRVGATSAPRNAEASARRREARAKASGSGVSPDGGRGGRAPDIDGLLAYRKSETRFLLALGVLFGVAALLWVIARDPKILVQLDWLGLKLNVNVGHAVVLGPLMLVAGCVLILVAATRLHEHRSLLSVPVARPSRAWLALLFFPAAVVLVLGRQFIMEFVPRAAGDDILGNCRTFDHWRMLWDPSLLEESGNFVYCFSGLGEVQNHLPEIFPPFESWAYMVVAGLCAWILSRAWREWNASGSGKGIE